MTKQTPTQQAIDDLWNALADAGAFRTGRNARLDTWLAKRFAVSATVFLTEAQCEEARRVLSAWLERVRDEKSPKNEPPRKD